MRWCSGGAGSVKIAIIGLGKIARDQHLPAIAATPGAMLAAVASRNAALPGVPCYETLEALLAAEPGIDAVALCTPPQVRRGQAMLALAAGKHVLLEKPPGATVAELSGMVEAAKARRVTLFASWHSRFAPAVQPARDFLAATRIRSAAITWKEDVRVWHPGQDWLWEPGGLGVFDPGINALSILTAVVPQPLFVTQADLTFPSNRAAPIAADLVLADGDGLQVSASFDFRQTGVQSWEIVFETDAGRLSMTGGGKRLMVDDTVLLDEPAAEYPALYRHFLALVAAGASDVDLAPLVHVADAFMLGRRLTAEPFEH